MTLSDHSRNLSSSNDSFVKSKLCIVGPVTTWNPVLTTLVNNAKINPDVLSHVDIHVPSQDYSVKFMPRFLGSPNITERNSLDNVHPSVNVTQIVRDADVLIFATPIEHLENVCNNLGDIKNTAFALTLTNGLTNVEDSKVSLVSERISNKLGIPCYSFTGNEREGILGCNSVGHAELLGRLFSKNDFKLNVTKDIAAVEVCGTFKEILNISNGLCNGLNVNDDIRYRLILQGLIEMFDFYKDFTQAKNIPAIFDNVQVFQLFNFLNSNIDMYAAQVMVESNKPINQVEQHILNGRQLLGTTSAKNITNLLKCYNMEHQYPLVKTVHQICSNIIKAKEIEKMPVAMMVLDVTNSQNKLHLISEKHKPDTTYEKSPVSETDEPQCSSVSEEEAMIGNNPPVLTTIMGISRPATNFISNQTCGPVLSTRSDVTDSLMNNLIKRKLSSKFNDNDHMDFSEKFPSIEKEPELSYLEFNRILFKRPYSFEKIQVCDANDNRENFLISFIDKAIRSFNSGLEQGVLLNTPQNYNLNPNQTQSDMKQTGIINFSNNNNNTNDEQWQKRIRKILKEANFHLVDEGDSKFKLPLNSKNKLDKQVNQNTNEGTENGIDNYQKEIPFTEKIEKITYAKNLIESDGVKEIHNKAKSFPVVRYSSNKSGGKFNLREARELLNKKPLSNRNSPTRSKADEVGERKGSSNKKSSKTGGDKNNRNTDDSDETNENEDALEFMRDEKSYISSDVKKFLGNPAPSDPNEISGMHDKSNPRNHLKTPSKYSGSKTFTQTKDNPTNLQLFNIHATTNQNGGNADNSTLNPIQSKKGNEKCFEHDLPLKGVIRKAADDASAHITTNNPKDNSNLNDKTDKAIQLTCTIDEKIKNIIIKAQALSAEVNAVKERVADQMSKVVESANKNSNTTPDNINKKESTPAKDMSISEPNVNEVLQDNINNMQETEINEHNLVQNDKSPTKLYPRLYTWDPNKREKSQSEISHKLLEMPSSEKTDAPELSSDRAITAKLDVFNTKGIKNITKKLAGSLSYVEASQANKCNSEKPNKSVSFEESPNIHEKSKHSWSLTCSNLETASEPIETTSELVETASERVQTASEQVGTSSEMMESASKLEESAITQEESDDAGLVQKLMNEQRLLESSLMEKQKTIERLQSEFHEIRENASLVASKIKAVSDSNTGTKMVHNKKLKLKDCCQPKPNINLRYHKYLHTDSINSLKNGPKKVNGSGIIEGKMMPSQGLASAHIIKSARATESAIVKHQLFSKAAEMAHYALKYFRK